MTMDEFDDIRADLDATELPQGERLILQVKPDWWRLALSVFHLKAIGVYFLVLALWRLGSTYHDTGSWALAADAVLTLLPPLGMGVSLLLILSFVTARATSFTLTDRRVVMRFGVALPAQVNIPLKDVDAAGVRFYADGSGDIPVTLPSAARNRPSYFQLWPYVRPFKFAAAEPMLRAVPDASSLARRLADALATVNGAEGLAGEPAAAATRKPVPHAEAGRLHTPAAA